MTDFEKLEQARQYFTRSQAETMAMYGLHPSVGLLYGAMVFRDAPMTLDEMCEMTGMSKTSMSTHVRELARLKLVKKAYIPKERKDLYEVERNSYRSFVEYFTQIWHRAVDLNATGIRDSEMQIQKLLESESLDPDVRHRAESSLEKLQYAKQYYRWLGELTTAFERGDLPTPVPQLSKEV